MADQLINSSTQQLLALGFVSPWLLWGLVLGAVPILIQWLHRRNYTERVWAAMRFLRAATKAQSRRLRFESLLLLAVRVLILVLAAFALAEPFLESAGWLPTSVSSVHRLLVIDTSMSMQHEMNGRTLGERAREAARRLVTQSRAGDSIQIVTIGRDSRAVVRLPAFDFAQALDELDLLEWTEEFGDVFAAMDLASRLLPDSARADQTRITVLSDFQRTNWWPDDEASRLRIQRKLVELAEHAQVSFFRIASDSAINTAVTDVSVKPVPVMAGGSLQVTAQIRRFGASSGEERRAELVENDRVLQTNMLEFDSSGQATTSFVTRWHEAGQRGLSVRIPGDVLRLDDQRWVTADVRAGLRVLLVNGRESIEPLGKATAFVEIALAPESFMSPESANARNLAHRPVVISEAQLAVTELAEFDVVFLCDVPFLSETERARLVSFVKSGGGLVISPGDQFQLSAYNQWFRQSGSQLMPIELLSIESDEGTPVQPFHFAEPTSRHPIVEPFLGNPQAGLTTANIYRYILCRIHDQPPAVIEESRPADESGVSPVRVAVAFNNGDPAILEHDLGDGRTLFISTSLDDQWGSWALWPSFLPMIHRIVNHVCDDRAGDPRIIGDRLDRKYAVQSIGLTAQVEGPDGRRAPAQITTQGGTTSIISEQAEQSGLYRLLLGPPINRAELMAVNVDPRESDLRTLNDAELLEALPRGTVRLLTETDTDAPAVGRPAPRSPLTSWLLGVVLVLLMCEQLMAWNARAGLIALGVSPVFMATLVVLPTLTAIVSLTVLGMVIARRISSRRAV